MTYIIETGGDKEILVLVVTSTSPEVSNLLRLQVRGSEGLTGERGGRNLENRQGRGNTGQWLSDAGDGRDETAGNAEVQWRGDYWACQERRQDGGRDDSRHYEIRVAAKGHKIL